MVEQVAREARIPTDKVIAMRSQGLSNNQIIQSLQRSGYDLTVIFNAMNQADIKNGIDYGKQGGSTMAEQDNMQFENAGLPEAPLGPEQPAGAPMTAPQQQMDVGQYGMNPGAEPYSMDQQSYGTNIEPRPDPYGQQQNFVPSGYETQRIEELAEAIIDEKWNEIVRSINKIIDWKERVESRVTKLEQRMDDLQKNFELLHKGVLGKVSDYDQNLQQVGAEIKAMEKVFQKVLPSLTENVGELSRITRNMKNK